VQNLKRDRGDPNGSLRRSLTSATWNDRKASASSIIPRKTGNPLLPWGRSGKPFIKTLHSANGSHDVHARKSQRANIGGHGLRTPRSSFQWAAPPRVRGSPTKSLGSSSVGFRTRGDLEDGKLDDKWQPGAATMARRNRPSGDPTLVINLGFQRTFAPICSCVSDGTWIAEGQYVAAIEVMEDVAIQ